MDNKTVLITGASRGIGRAFAVLCAKNKDFDNICVIGRNTNLSSLVEEIGKIDSNKNVLTFYGDVGDYEFVSETVEKIMKKTKRIDLLVNSAAISYVGLLIDMTKADWDETISSNVDSVFNTCRATVPHMVRVLSGKIINVSSVWGLCGASYEVAYSASKGAINSFTKALAKELGPSHIAVNAIAFGIVDTDMNGHLTEEDKAMVVDEVPYGAMATPKEAAEAIYKMYEMPDYFTGEVLKFDGAWI